MWSIRSLHLTRWDIRWELKSVHIEEDFSIPINDRACLSSDKILHIQTNFNSKSDINKLDNWIHLCCSRHVTYRFVRCQPDEPAIGFRIRFDESRPSSIGKSIWCTPCIWNLLQDFKSVVCLKTGSVDQLSEICILNHLRIRRRAFFNFYWLKPDD